MKTSIWLATAGAVMGVATMGACGNGGSTTGTGGTGGTGTSSHGSGGKATTATGMTASSGGTTASAGSTTSASSTTGTGGSAGCSGAQPVALTVLNFDAWCTVSVAGGTPSGAGSQTVCVADGSVALEATANTGFKLGKWFGTSGDTGTGDPGTVTGTKSDAKVTVSGTVKCVSVCCPFADGTGCPTTKQCP